MFEHQFLRGLILGMQSVEADELAIEIESLQKGARGWDFVGFIGHNFAAQIMLSGRGGSSDNIFSTTVFGYFAIQNDQVAFRYFATNLLLPNEHYFLYAVDVYF